MILFLLEENPTLWNFIIEHLTAILGVIASITAILHKYVQIKEKWNKEKEEVLFSTKFIPDVLSAIDNLGQEQPTIIVVTTNDYREIPNVIRRPGRFSVLTKFSLFDEELVDMYVDSMWDEVTPTQRGEFHSLLVGKAQAWAYSMVGKGISPDVALETFAEAIRQDWQFHQED